MTKKTGKVKGRLGKWVNCDLIVRAVLALRSSSINFTKRALGRG